MSRRSTKEGQRLAEDLAKVLNSRPADPRLVVDPAEARKIRQDALAERRERRATSMRVLLLPQYAPWIAGAALFATGAATWLLRVFSTDVFLPAMVALLVGLGLAWAAWMMGRRHLKWRAELIRAAIGASVWLLFTATTGPSWTAVLLCALLVVVSSSSWWKANRIPYPTAPAPQTKTVPKKQGIGALWDEYLGGQGMILGGSYLSGQDTTRPNCESWMVNLRPGKQTVTGTIGYLELIAGGLMTPVRNLVLEPHEDQSPNHLKLTVVHNSPIEKTLMYSGARIVGDDNNLIEVGPYADGDGWAQWRMWQPGEKPMTGSWLSGLIIAGTGIGKSRLMELLAAAYMATGYSVVWFIDPQGGASSPALQEHADWYVSSDGAGRMIDVLEQIAAAREAEMRHEKWSRFDPSPERPGIVVFMDEFHVTVKRYADRLEALARKQQKVGIAIAGLTQGGSLESLGKDILRASLMSNLIVMKTGSNQTKNLLPGLTVDPETLPKIAGFGYTIGTDGSRTAPFRSEYVEDPSRWFKQYRMPKLDALSANAAGPVYQLRAKAAEEEQEANRLYVEQLRAGVQPMLPVVEEDGPEPVQDEPVSRPGQVAAFPASPAVNRPQDMSSRHRILTSVAQGVTRTEEIGKAVGLKPSRLHEVLKDLVEDGQLVQPTRGVYALATAAMPPVR